MIDDDARPTAMLLPIDGIAAGFLAVLLLNAWFRDTLYRALWVGELLLTTALWLAALLVALLAVRDALRDDRRISVRLREAFAVPAALAVAWLATGPMWEAGRWSAARLQWSRERPCYEATAAREANRPLAFPYLTGVPDGGVAIVRWSGDPMRLDRAVQARLTGERLLGCRRLASGYHLCGYD